MTSDQPLLGWHFLAEDGYTQFEPRIKVEVGQTLTVDPPLQLCLRGLHASVRAIDALYYAPGPIVCRVELSGEILHGTNKMCAQHRKVLWMADATRVLHLFACDEAERVLQATGVTDPRCFAAIETKRRWFEGKATNEELSDARSAARCVIGSVATYIAWAVTHLAAASVGRAIIEVDGSPAVNARLTAALMRLQPGETS